MENQNATTNAEQREQAVPTTLTEQLLVFIEELASSIEQVNTKLDMVLLMQHGTTYSRTQACTALGIKRDQLDTLVQKGILIPSLQPNGLPYASHRFSMEAILTANETFKKMGKPKKIK